MEDLVKICMLIEIYGKLLTNKQYQILNDYYNNDLSLGEISENLDITRQAVMDTVKKSKKKLEYFEQELKILKNKQKIADKTDNISEYITEIEQNKDNINVNKIKKYISDIKNISKI